MTQPTRDAMSGIAVVLVSALVGISVYLIMRDEGSIAANCHVLHCQSGAPVLLNDDCVCLERAK